MTIKKQAYGSIFLFSCTILFLVFFSKNVCAAPLEQIMVLKSAVLLKSVVGIVFIMGGFGLVGLTVGALFGRIKWRWAACLALGLFIASTALSIVAYVVDDTWFNWNVALTYDANWTGDSVNVTNE